MPRSAYAKLPPLELDGETIGGRLRRIRKEHEYTQTELAGKIGITQTLVSDYETGRARPPAEMLIRFAKVLDVSADELLGLEKPKKGGTLHGNNRIIRRLKRIEELPPADRKAVFRVIDAMLESHSGPKNTKRRRAS